ncbi:hypothetical protein NQZ68_038410 [Dissostichus eleginoides]|nr:hypothetical protein NQZ68_038410 [Dissostichus eleginoides]
MKSTTPDPDDQNPEATTAGNGDGATNPAGPASTSPATISQSSTIPNNPTTVGSASTSPATISQSSTIPNNPTTVGSASTSPATIGQSSTTPNNPNNPTTVGPASTSSGTISQSSTIPNNSATVGPASTSPSTLSGTTITPYNPTTLTNPITNDPASTTASFVSNSNTNPTSPTSPTTPYTNGPATTLPGTMGDNTATLTTANPSDTFPSATNDNNNLKLKTVLDYTENDTSSVDGLKVAVDKAVALLKKQASCLILASEAETKDLCAVSRLREEMMAIITDTVKEVPTQTPEGIQVIARGLAALVQRGTELSSSAQMLSIDNNPFAWHEGGNISGVTAALSLTTTNGSSIAVENLSENIKVGVHSTHLVTECLCNHLTFFGSSFFVTPNLVDPSRTAELFATFAENPLVVCFVASLFGAYLLVVLWARRKDIKDRVKVKVTVLDDNDPMDEYRYLLSVSTGHRRGAATSSKDFSDGHLWYSVINRPPSSNFTCVQRVSCCFTLLLCTMLTSVMFYGIPTDPSEQTMDMGLFEFTWQQFMIGVQSSLIMFPVNILIVSIFRNTRPRETSCCKRKTEKPDAEQTFVSQSNTNNMSVNVTLDTVITDIKRIAQSLSKTMKSNIPCTESEFGPAQQVDINAVLSRVEHFITMNNKASDTAQPELEYSPTMHPGSTLEGIQKKSNKNQYLYRQLCHIEKQLSQLGPSDFPDPHSYSRALQQVHAMKVFLEDQLFTSGFNNPEEPNQKKLSPEDSTDGDCKEPLTVRRDNSLYVPPAAADIEKMKRDKIMEQKAFALLKEILTYMGFMWMLLLVAYGEKDPNAFFLKRHIRDSFSQGTKDSMSPGDVFTWANTLLLKNLFGVYPGFITDGNSKLVGNARLRQLRVQKNSCQIAGYMQQFVPDCHAPYSWDLEDMGSYDPGWNHLVKENVSRSTFSPWTYQTQTQLRAHPFWGKMVLYRGGGFVAEIGPDSQNASRELQSVRLYQSTGGLHIFVLAAEIIYLLFILYYMFLQAKLMKQQRCAYFRSTWNLLELSIILLSWSTLAIYINRTLLGNRDITYYQNHKDQFAHFYETASADSLLQYMIAFLVLLSTFKLWHLLRLNAKMNMLTAALQRAWSDVSGLLLVIVVMFVAYSISSNVIYGWKVSSYKTLTDALLTLISLQIGIFNYNEVLDNSPVLGGLLFGSCIVFMTFVVLNLLLSVILVAFHQEQIYHKPSDEEEIVDLMLKKICSLFGIPYENTNETPGPDLNKADESTINNSKNILNNSSIDVKIF